jgi:diguanylate cyclase (GGDEF)-like protein/PAS domain S-box-containing protein
VQTTPEVELTTIADGRQVAGLIQKEKFDCILLDYIFEHTDALQIMQQITASKADIPVIVLTGEGSEKTAVELMKAGAYDYVIKSDLNRTNARDHLLHIIEGAIRLHRIHREYHLTQQVLIKSERRYRGLVENSTVIIMRFFPDDCRINLVNEWFCTYFGVERITVLGERLQDFVPPEQYDEIYGIIATLGKNQPSSQYQSSLRIRGQLKHQIWNVQAILDDATGRLSNTSASAMDITELKTLQERVQHMAQHDSLTDLPNRSYFLQQAEYMLKQAKRHQTGFALLFIDLNRFKPVNDNYGHEYGDEVLRQTAAAIRGVLPEVDFVARFGGDEFVVLLDHTSEPHRVQAVADKITAAICAPQSVYGVPLTVGAAIGTASFPDDGATIQELIHAADRKMYSNKRPER